MDLLKSMEETRMRPRVSANLRPRRPKPAVLLRRVGPRMVKLLKLNRPASSVARLTRHFPLARLSICTTTSTVLCSHSVSFAPRSSKFQPITTTCSKSAATREQRLNQGPKKTQAIYALSVKRKSDRMHGKTTCKTRSAPKTLERAD